MRLLRKLSDSTKSHISSYTQRTGRALFWSDRNISSDYLVSQVRLHLSAMTHNASNSSPTIANDQVIVHAVMIAA